jgi:toxin HigB-1
MIISFGSEDTEKLWNVERIKRIPIEIQQIARRKRRMLNNSQIIGDLKIPPSNRLEKLSGKLKDLYSIRINDQWRIVFNWENNHAKEVEIIDYHKYTIDHEKIIKYTSWRSFA